jgi:hypothetical protein
MEEAKANTSAEGKEYGYRDGRLYRKRFKISSNANPTSLFILVRIMLKSVDKDDSLLKDNEITIYRQIIKSILYLLNNTRPNTLYIIGQLA